jgi:acetyl-CoA carboxylase carboxyl transferase subunit alpha
MMISLDFEKNIIEIEQKLNELRHLSRAGDLNIAKEISHLEEKLKKQLLQIYTHLTPWQKVQVARHPSRPHCLDFIRELIDDFVVLSGDRKFGEDQALLGGLGRFRGLSVVVMGTEKGHDTDSRIKHNFGMAKPEGYRKAQRLMELANQFHLPILTFIDTAGAHPAKEAEERGQAEAIARCIETLLTVEVPVIATITGEGGSGGAIALAVANDVLMLEHAVYSVVSPEGCASILWRSADKKQEAAAAQRLTAPDLKDLNVIDAIVQEPLGGAQRSPQSAITKTGDAIEVSLSKYIALPGRELCAHRRTKFLTIGEHVVGLK